MPEKRDRLRKIPGEVPELHDWLHVLFSRMPNIVHTEYTHGQNEMGADFVLETLNATTGRNEFVGIIAKKGTIKQDSPDIERQIKECAVPRIIKHGKDEQSLPTVWIVTNETITANAERKIRHDFRAQAIQFFSADDIIRWTDQYAPHLWEDIPSKIGEYFRKTMLQIEELDRSANLLGEQAIEVKLDVDLSPVDSESYKRKNQKREAVLLKDEVQHRKVVFIEGEMGAGKSQMLRTLCKDLCNSKAFNALKLIPVFTTYRDLCEKHGGSIKAVINTTLHDLSKMIDGKSANALLIVDGLDEVSTLDHEEEAALIELVRQIQESANAKTVISCRSGIVQLTLLKSMPELRHLEVRPLTIRKMSSFIKSVCDQAKLSNRIVRDLGKSDLFRQLPQNPIAALLLTRLMLQSRSRDELPQTLTDLYAKALELMLGRWDMDKGLVGQQEHDVSRRLCGQIANLMIENQLPAIALSEVKSYLRQYLDDRNLSIDEDALLDRLFARSGVLALNTSESTVRFRHRSFAEFFCAEEWLRSGSFNVDGRALKPQWATVYFFAIGQRSDCEEILKDILALPPSSEDERLGRILAIPTYLLAGHMTPYRIVESCFPGLMLDAARYYTDVCSKKLDSMLSIFSPMSLLYIMQYVLRHKYGYQYFRKAIDATALEIEDSLESDVVKAHALFFLGAIANDLDYPDAMKFLVEKYKASDLPIAISAATHFELSKSKSNKLSPILRAFNKRVYKMIKTNETLRNDLEVLFKKPINSLKQKHALKQAGKSKG